MIFENAPALEIDKVLYKNLPMPPRVRRERRVVWNLIKHLHANGWTVCKVYDGDEYTETSTAVSALEVIFNLDDAWVGFISDSRTHYVRLVLGNDLEVISDWNFTDGDPDGFDAAMEKFDAEVYA